MPYQTIQPAGSALHFAEEYEQLVGLICAAARFGISPGFDSDYARLREDLAPNIPMLTRLIEPQPGTGERERSDTARDLLEWLIRPKTLGELLESDSGDLIERATIVSEVLFALCEE